MPGSDPVVSQLNFGQGNVLFDLLNAGFNAVYEAPAYRALKRIYDGSGWRTTLMPRSRTNSSATIDSLRREP